MIAATKVFSNLTRLHFAWAIEEFGWEIGDHSYGHPLVLDPECALLKIGRFCSIGPDVTIVLGNHRTDLVSTYPFRTLSHLWPEAASGAEDHEARGDVELGHDIWIGAGATILPGATIGSGAVLAARTVVRSLVPAYAVVAGNPGRVVRHRFDAETVERLLRAAWWRWDEALLRAALPLMVSPDIQAFLRHAETMLPSGGGE